MTLQKTSFSLSGADLSLPDVKRLWNEHMSARGLRGQIDVHTDCRFSILGTVYSEDYPRVGIFERDSGASAKDRAVSDTLEYRDWAEKNDVGFFLYSASKGASRVTHAGREIELGEEDCVLINMAEKMKLENPGGDTRITTLYIPSAVIRTWMPAPEDMAGRLLSKESDWGRALSASMHGLSLRPNVDNLPVTIHSFTEQIGCQLALASFAPAIRQDMGSYRASVYRRLLNTMRENYMDMNFDMERLSLIHGIPKPTLYAAFAAANTTFMTELQAIRLQRAQQLLRDARFDRHAIAEISTMTGFVSASYFSTAFSKRFGVPPTEFRKSRRA